MRIVWAGFSPPCAAGETLPRTFTASGVDPCAKKRHYDRLGLYQMLVGEWEAAERLRLTCTSTWQRWLHELAAVKRNTQPREDLHLTLRPRATPHSQDGASDTGCACSCWKGILRCRTSYLPLCATLKTRLPLQKGDSPAAVMLDAWDLRTPRPASLSPDGG